MEVVVIVWKICSAHAISHILYILIITYVYLHLIIVS